jgi:phage shock protein A
MSVTNRRWQIESSLSDLQVKRKAVEDNLKALRVRITELNLAIAHLMAELAEIEHDEDT